MGFLEDAAQKVDQTANDFQDGAEEAKRRAEAEAEELKQQLGEATADAEATIAAAQQDLDAAIAAAQQQVRAIVAKAQRQVARAAEDARRVTVAAYRDARRRSDAASQDFQNRVAKLQTEVERAAGNTKIQIANALPTATFVPDVTYWLSSHPSVMGQITWQTTAGLPVPYPLWTLAMKRDLEQAFTRAWNSDNIMPADPVENIMNLDDGDTVVQILDYSDAWTMFIGYVAQSLSVEIGNRVQWSILQCSIAGLAELFHSTRMFIWNPFLQGYQINHSHGDALPSSPQTASNFLFNGLVDTSSRQSTIANLLDWCRSNLTHFYYDLTAGNAVDQWQYRGFPPVSRMLTGTPMNSDPSDGIRHRTAGCVGTVGFLRAILRTANIPVQLLSVAAVRTENGQAEPVNHTQLCFVEDGLYLSHGDDPYSGLVYATPRMPISELLIDQKQYNEWFGPGVSNEARAKNIGRRPRDLAIQYLPNLLLRDYCDDRANGRSHDNGSVIAEFDGLYTVAELEAMNLWSRMDDKIASLGGCGAIPPPP